MILHLPGSLKYNLVTQWQHVEKMLKCYCYAAELMSRSTGIVRPSVCPFFCSAWILNSKTTRHRKKQHWWREVKISKN